MSESKANLQKHAYWLASERDRLERDVIFLLQALVDIGEKHPSVDLPDLGNNRFSEGVWRHISC